MAVQDGVYALHYLCGGADAGRHVLEVGVDAFLDGVEEVEGLAEGVQKGAELSQRQEVYGCIFADRFQERDGVYVSGSGEAFLKHEDEAHLVSEKMSSVDFLRDGGEFLRLNPFCSVFRAAAGANIGPNLIKAKLCLQPLYHFLCFLLG